LIKDLPSSILYTLHILTERRAQARGATTRKLKAKSGYSRVALEQFVGLCLELFFVVIKPYIICWFDLNLPFSAFSVLIRDL